VLALCAGVKSYIDDEYQMAGVDDPRILITTSRNPSTRLKQFAKVLCAISIVFFSGLTSQCFYQSRLVVWDLVNKSDLC